MNQAIIIRGRYLGQTFIPEEPLPIAEGRAELTVFPFAVPQAPCTVSIFDLFGKAASLRSAEDIAAQMQEEHAGWEES